MGHGRQLFRREWERLDLPEYVAILRWLECCGGRLYIEN